MRKAFILTIVLLLAACNLPVNRTSAPIPQTPQTTDTSPAPATPQRVTSTSSASPTPLPATPTSTATATPLPPIEGADPSDKVAAFYYPWYGNPTTDGEWIHWTQNSHHPPKDIASDYFPALGAYSSNDPAVVAQHMTWLRKAGIGVIIVSWWGQGSREEQPLPLILEMAQRYGIKVTFHIEPYAGRTADRLLSDLKYLYARYGSHPAFFLSTATSRYSPGNQPKPMFFVWAIEVQDAAGKTVEASYWQNAMDAIHALPQGGLVIANTEQGSWITGGHFDGLYNYATLHLTQTGGFAWAASLPPDSLYIPSVIPGFSAARVGYSSDTTIPRLNGDTYTSQWTAALGSGVQPAMVTVTSFNEWHEGSNIEPPAVGVDSGRGYSYADFGTLPPDGFLTLTRQWVDKFLSATWPETYRVRIQVTTTSDWTTLNVVSGGTWLRPELIAVSPAPADASIEDGDRFLLTQPLANAENGTQVQATWDLLVSGLDPAGNLVLNIDRGSIGQTSVTIFNYLGREPMAVKTFYWAGVTNDRNSHQVMLPASILVNPAP
jgi:hypothetical protein